MAEQTLVAVYDTASHADAAVRDTVRRTEVDIDDSTDVNRTAGTTSTKGGTGTSGSNPPGTMASRGVDKALGTNVSGANPTRKA